MNFRRTRLLVPVFLSTAGLAVAGCGGGGGGDESAYVKTYEGACKKIVASATGSQTELSKLATGSKVSDATVTKVRGIIEGVLDTFDTQISVLADADAPGKWSDFQDSIEKTSKDAEKAVATAKGQLAGIRTQADLGKITQVFQSLQLKSKDSQDLPDDLADEVPSCKTLLASGS